MELPTTYRCSHLRRVVSHAGTQPAEPCDTHVFSYCMISRVFAAIAVVLASLPSWHLEYGGALPCSESINHPIHSRRVVLPYRPCCARPPCPTPCLRGWWRAHIAPPALPPYACLTPTSPYRANRPPVAGLFNPPRACATPRPALDLLLHGVAPPRAFSAYAASRGVGRCAPPPA